MSNSLASLRGAVAKTSDEPRKKTVRDIIMERQADIAKALPAAAGMTPERLTMVAYTLVHSNPKLGGCTPQSLIGALMTAAQLGLEPGPQQHVYFIPRWNSRMKADEATFMIGYKGMVELARRNGVQIKTRTVYQGDVFEIEYGFEDRVVHKPALDEDRQGEVRGYYLTATWDGGSYVAWMNLRDIERIRERSLAKDTGPWKTDYDAMARKGLWVETPIPTPFGWKTMGDLKVGDRVFDMHGKQCTVTAVSEVRNIDCHRVTFANGASVVCDHDHRWLAALGVNGKRDGWKVLDTDALIAHREASSGRDRRVTVPVAGALEIPDVALPIDPWFLGYWLGNGSSGSATLTCHIEDRDYVTARVEAAGYKLGVVADHATAKSTKVGVRSGLAKALADLGLHGDKHVPADFLRASASQRAELLRGLMDSDGHVDKARGRARFTSTTADLTSAVAELARSLGEVVHLPKPRQVTGFGKTVTVHEVAWQPSFAPVGSPRKVANYRPRKVASYRGVKAIEPTLSVPTKCISVDSPTETYLCGIDMVPTHNTLVRAAFNANQIPQSLAIAQALNADEQVRTSYDTSAIDVPREPDATEDRHVPTSVGSPALPAPRDDEADGPDGGEAHEGRQDAGDAPAEDRGDSDSDRVGGEADLNPPDEMPDDIEAALMWLRSLTPKELREQAKRYRSVVPKNAADVDAMTELAQRIIDTRTAS